MARVTRTLLLTIMIVVMAGCSMSRMMAPSLNLHGARMPVESQFAIGLHPVLDVSDEMAVSPVSVADSAQIAEQQRQVIYSAQLGMVVEQLAPGLQAVRKIAEGSGGYLQSMDDNSISVRVPAGKFNAVLKQIEDLGSVINRRVKGQDVTEELHDLDVRLKNALQMRDRLSKLLDRADKVEDALKIEVELGRVTETIERLKGTMKFLKDNVAFSTITVNLNTPARQEDNGIVKLRQVPFSWVRGLGSEIANGSPDYYTTKGKWFWKIRFSIPTGYVKYDEERNYTRAMSGDAVMIKVQRSKNLKGGDLEFWKCIALRSLTEQKVITVTKSEEIKLANGKKAILITGTRNLGHQTFGYLVAIACVKKRVYAYECWGLQAAFKQDRDKAMQSIKSLRVK